jgi:hypothetical protein
MPQTAQAPSGPVRAGMGTSATVPAPARPVEKIPAPSSRRKAAGRRIPLFVLLAALVLVNLAGLPYYILSQAQRVRSPLHPWFKPTGYVGQTAGVAALLLFLFMWLYPMRKNFRWLAFTGPIAKWLDVHIVAGLCIPLLASVHAAWRFTGLIGLGYASMMVVVLSGFVGKYLYARIPRSRSGLEMTLEEINTERRVLLKYVASETRMSVEDVERILSPVPAPGQDAGLMRSLGRLLRDDFDRWRAGRQLTRRWRKVRGAAKADRRVLKLVRRMARRQMALSQQVRFLNATHRVFQYWHVAHRPVAISALLAVVIHVVVAVTMRVTWFY